MSYRRAWDSSLITRTSDIHMINGSRPAACANTPSNDFDEALDRWAVERPDWAKGPGRWPDRCFMCGGSVVWCSAFAVRLPHGG